MRKIWVYDDEAGRGQAWAEKIKNVRFLRRQFEVGSVGEQEFGKEMTTLITRQEQVRRKGEWSEEPSLFDDASILVIDYDLLKSSDPRSFLVGEIVAYLARCFSTCGLIVGLNQYGTNRFDLSLRGHPESFADLDIGSEQLDNPGLWGLKFSGFRPWHWPVLPHYLESFEMRMDDVRRNRGIPICKVLGIEDVIKILPRSAAQFIGGDPAKTTFSEFVTRSGNGLRGRDKQATDEMVKRIGAARISKWLECLILPGQDTLVDAPHLASRFPSLLEGRVSSISAWNKTTGFSKAVELGLTHDTIAQFVFEKSFWLSRSAWFWGKLADSQKIKEVVAPWERKPTDYVFCEDSSSFYRREESREFLADLDSPYVRRYIHHFEGVDYAPRVYLME